MTFMHKTVFFDDPETRKELTGRVVSEFSALGGVAVVDVAGQQWKVAFRDIRMKSRRNK